MAAPGKTGSEYKHSDQERDNKSHDDTYGLNAVIPVGEYNGAVYRLQVDASGNLKVTSTGGSGGLTDTELRATPVPVSGTFWQTTQPVSIAATVTTSEAAPSTIYNGKKSVTTAGTRVTLASSQAVKSVTIKALNTNTGIIYVGDTSVASTNGFQLSAGESISMDIANLNTVNLDSSVSGESVTYIGVN